MTLPPQRPGATSPATNQPSRGRPSRGHGQPSRGRPGRRVLAALSAALLAGSLLALIAGVPVQAANTASELLHDHDEDATTARIREFAGATRYDTSLRLANRYVIELGGIGSVSTVIVASGETLIDAVTSASLSAANSAPVLLTRPSGLDRRAASFIEDNGVGQVYVVGGTAAVPDRIVEQLRALETAPAVERISGADRAATAVEIADELFSPAAWCGTSEITALLVNGGDFVSDALAAGPLAYALQMPMLLTGAGSLSDSTFDFLSRDDSEIERVVIVGGTDAVSEAVADELEALGLRTQRVGVTNGQNVDTSVELARLMTAGECAADIDAATDTVALVNSESLADGVSAAPVLGTGLDGSGPIPVLLIDDADTVPERVRSYLAATPVTVGTGSTKANLEILAIGGTAVVSQAAMNAAIEAASAGASLGVTIQDVSPGDTAVKLLFNDATVLDDTGASNAEKLSFKTALRAALYVNGSFASVALDSSLGDDAGGPISITSAAAAGAAASCGTSVEVTVNLTHELGVDDVIEVRPSGFRFGGNDDLRTITGDTYTVVAPRVVSSPPTLEVFAIPEASRISVILTGIGVPGDYRTQLDELSSTVGPLDVSKISVNSAGSGSTEVFAVAYGANAAARAAETAGGIYYGRDVDVHSPYHGLRIHRVALFEDADKEDGAYDPAEDTTPYKLKARDTITLAAGAIARNDDAGPVPSRVVRKPVSAPVPSFRITSLRMSDTDAGFAGNADAEPLDGVYVTHSSGKEKPIVSNAVWAVPQGAAATQQLMVAARWTGEASGAVGNLWRITTDKAAGWEDNNDRGDGPAELGVFVNVRNRVILIRYIYGTPTYAELQQALNGNEIFAEHFRAETPCATASGKMTLADATSRPPPYDEDREDEDEGKENWRLPGEFTKQPGRSSVVFEVAFNDYVRTVGQAFGIPLNTYSRNDEGLDNAAPYAVDFGQIEEYAFLNVEQNILSALLDNFMYEPSEGTGDLTLYNTRTFLLWDPVPFVDAAGTNGGSISSKVYVRYSTANPAKIPTARGGTGRGFVAFGGSGVGDFNPETDVAFSYYDSDTTTAGFQNDRNPGESYYFDFVTRLLNEDADDDGTPDTENDLNYTQTGINEVHNAPSRPRATPDRNLRILR